MKIFQVDSFTDQLFKGNPAGVCLVEGDVEDAWMQNVAFEMNLSETAFVWKVDAGYKIRFFSPANEIDLCGHATLASSHILFETGLVSQGQSIEFASNVGPLFAKNDNGWIQLDFPTTELQDVTDHRKEALMEALSMDVLSVWQGHRDILVHVADEQKLKSWKPDFKQIETLHDGGVLLTTKSNDPGYDFVSRCFFPIFGIDEDPVTGSAHCSLSPYWAGVLGKTELTAFQASKRGGTLKLIQKTPRTLISGQANTFFEGELSGC